MAPGQSPFAYKHEGIGEVIERDGEPLHDQEQLVGRQAARAVLDGRDRLAVLEAEDECEVFLGEFVLLPQRLDAFADQ